MGKAEEKMKVAVVLFAAACVVSINAAATGTSTEAATTQMPTCSDELIPVCCGTTPDATTTASTTPEATTTGGDTTTTGGDTTTSGSTPTEADTTTDTTPTTTLALFRNFKSTESEECATCECPDSTPGPDNG